MNALVRWHLLMAAWHLYWIAFWLSWEPSPNRSTKSNSSTADSADRWLRERVRR